MSHKIPAGWVEVMDIKGKRSLMNVSYLDVSEDEGLTNLYNHRGARVQTYMKYEDVVALIETTVKKAVPPI